YLSFGVDARTEMQFIENQDWLRENDDRGILFQRFMGHLDWHLGSAVRVFGQLKSGFAVSRNGDPSPLDRDRLDVHQLFLELGKYKFRVQLGRKELWYGSRRLISIREGTNIRQSFDGIRGIYEGKSNRTDVLFYFYNPQNIDFFDNEINTDQKIWGIYQVWKKLFKGHQLDLYYLGSQNESPSFEAGREGETRHSVGARHWGKRGRLLYNTEFVYQWGDQSGRSIRAWTISTDLQYKLSDRGIKPVIGLKTEAISGDKNPDDQRLQTFNALYPRGGYFGLLAVIGPANLIDLHPSIKLALGKKWEISFDWDAFWRYSLGDGIYFPSGRINISGSSSRERFIGHQFGMEVVYPINHYLEWEASCFYFITGPFLDEMTDGANLLQLGTSFSCRF
ncbi:MAG: alginate export family protein, partial [Bacteroidota bacterium]